MFNTPEFEALMTAIKTLSSCSHTEEVDREVLSALPQKINEELGKIHHKLANADPDPAKRAKHQYQHDAPLRAAYRLLFKEAMHQIVKAANVATLEVFYEILGEPFIEYGLKGTCLNLSWIGLSARLYNGTFIVALANAIDSPILAKARDQMLECERGYAVYTSPEEEALACEKVSSSLHVICQHFHHYDAPTVTSLQKAIPVIYGDRLAEVAYLPDDRGRLPIHFYKEIIKLTDPVSPTMRMIPFAKAIGLSLHELDTNGNNIMHLAMMSGGLTLPRVQYLHASLGIDPTVRNHEKDSTLDMAARYCDHKTFQYLFSSIPHTGHEEASRRLLHSAARAGNTEVVDWVLTNVKCTSVNAEDEYGYRPIHYAARHGHAGLLDKLRPKTMLNTTTGETPLHLAAQFQRLDVIKHLLTWGADILPNDLNKLGYGALHLSIIYNKSANCECVKQFFSAPIVDKTARTQSGDGIIHLFMRYRFLKGQATVLMNKAIKDHPEHNFFKANKFNVTPLHTAACYDRACRAGGALDFMQTKISGFKMNRRVKYYRIQDKQGGNTAAHLAMMVGNQAAYDKIIPKVGAIKNNNEKTPDKVGLNRQYIVHCNAKSDLNYRSTSFFENDMPTGVSPSKPVNVVYSRLAGARRADIFSQQKPADSASLEQWYIDQMNAASKSLESHYIRLFETAFYTFIAYWRQGVVIKRENAEMFQHGVSPVGSGHNAAHDSSILQRFSDVLGDRHGKVFIVPRYGQEPNHDHLASTFVQCGILDGTHFLDTLNATTDLPASANRFDTAFCDGKSGFGGIRDKYIDLINKTAAGTIDPREAYMQFIEVVKDEVDAFDDTYAYHKSTPTEPLPIRADFVATLKRVTDDCHNDIAAYPLLTWLMLSSSDQLIFQGATPDEVMAIEQLRMVQLQDEIFSSPSTFLKPLRFSDHVPLVEKQMQRAKTAAPPKALGGGAAAQPK